MNFSFLHYKLFIWTSNPDFSFYSIVGTLIWLKILLDEFGYSRDFLPYLHIGPAQYYPPVLSLSSTFVFFLWCSFSSVILSSFVWRVTFFFSSSKYVFVLWKFVWNIFWDLLSLNGEMKYWDSAQKKFMEKVSVLKIFEISRLCYLEYDSVWNCILLPCYSRKYKMWRISYSRTTMNLQYQVLQVWRHYPRRNVWRLGEIKCWTNV